MEVPVIETSRLILERLTHRFCSQSYVSWMNDAEVIRYMESGGDYTIEKLSAYLKGVENSKIFFWAITLKESGKHIGNIKIDPISQKHERGEYGIMMGDRSEWGKGYAREASEAVIRFCFETLKLRKVTLGVLTANAAAVSLYKKMGFVQEGLYKDHSVHQGKWHDTLRMAIFNPAIYK